MGSLVDINEKQGVDIVTVDDLPQTPLVSEADWIVVNKGQGNGSLTTKAKIDQVFGGTISAAKSAADRAETAAANAQSISDSGTYYITDVDPDGTIAGLAGTEEGKSFRVAQGMDGEVSFIYYRKTAGKAVPIADAASANAVKNLTGIIKKSKGPKTFLRFRDYLGMVIARWTSDSEGGVRFTSPLVSFDRTGYYGEKTEISEHVVKNKDFTVKKSNDGTFKIIDKVGLILMKIKNGILYLPRIKAVFNDKTEIVHGTNTVVLNDSKGNILSIKDSRGLVGLRIDKNCILHANIAGQDSGSGGKAVMTEDQIISMVRSAAQEEMSNFGRRIFNNVPKLGNPLKTKKKVSFWIVYGQSFSVGAQSGVALSTTQTLGNVMLGGSPRGSTYGNLANSYVYAPVGGANVFQPLVEVLQDNLGNIVTNTSGGYGETIASSFANNLKRYHNEAMGVENDEDFLIGVACCGVSGRTIEQLKKGATPEIYNRVETALDGIAEAATAAGYDWEIGGIIYIQGENDNGQSFEFYSPRLQTMHDDLITSCMTKSGQTTKPLFMLNQVGNTYVREMGVPTAQLALAQNNENVVLIGSYSGLQNPGQHLTANSYRIVGARYARDAFRHMSGYGSSTFKCASGMFKGASVYLGMTPHVAPLQFAKVFDGWDLVDQADKGITVTDGSGTLAPADIQVSIVSPTVLKVLCSRPLSGKVTVLFGDKGHKGLHNIADSGNEVSYNKWEFGVPNQYPRENVEGLVGKQYDLRTFAAIQSITCKEV